MHRRGRTIICAAIAASMVLSASGCSEVKEDIPAAPDDAKETYTAEYTGEAPMTDVEEDYDNAGRSFENGATQLAMTDGSLEIHRRTRGILRGQLRRQQPQRGIY